MDSAGTADRDSTRHFAAWTAAIAPGAVNDYTAAIAFARAEVDANPVNPLFHNDLGAILLRAGQFAEAKTELQKAVVADDSDNTSRSYAWYFLALAAHHLGNSEEAAAHLKPADELAEKELTGSALWNRKLTFELLRNEAHGLIGDVAQ